GERQQRSEHPSNRGGESGLPREHPSRASSQALRFSLCSLTHRTGPIRNPPDRHIHVTRTFTVSTRDIPSALPPGHDAFRATFKTSSSRVDASELSCVVTPTLR